MPHRGSVTQSPFKDAGHYSAEKGCGPREPGGRREGGCTGEESGQDTDEGDNSLHHGGGEGNEDSVGQNREKYTADHGEGDKGCEQQAPGQGGRLPGTEYPHHHGQGGGLGTDTRAQCGTQSPGKYPGEKAGPGEPAHEDARESGVAELE